MNLIHKIFWLPCNGKDPIEIARKSGDLALIEAMKEQYKLEKKMRGYTISNINDKVVSVATQLLAMKVMRKCHGDEVPVLIATLVEQCEEGVQFNWAKFLYEDFLTNCKEA